MTELLPTSKCLSSTYIPPIVSFVKNNGICERDILAGTKLLDLAEEDMPKMISLKDCEQIISNVYAINGLSPMLLGILVGMSGNTGSFGQLGFIGVCSGTIDEALRSTMRFTRLITPIFHYEYSDKGDHVALTCEDKYNTPEPVGDFIIGLVLGGVHSMAYALLGDRFFEFSDDTVAYLKADLTQYPDLVSLSHVPIEMHFGCNENRLTFSKRMAIADLSGGNKNALKTAVEVSGTLLEDELSSAPCDNIVASVTKILKHQGSNTISLDDVAKALCVSARTVTRQLSAFNTSFRELSHEVKMKQAKAFLSRDSISIKEIAYYLGYSDVSNFSLAFKRYFGESPGNFRRKSKQIS